MNRILLQSFKTGLYLDPSGTWTSNRDLAQGFPNTVLPTELKLRRRLSDAFVIVVPQTESPARRVRLRKQSQPANGSLRRPVPPRLQPRWRAR
jgi:hypothetical protein